MNREFSQLRLTVFIGIIFSIILLSVKIIVGIWGESRVLLYDGLESLVDLIVLIFVMHALRVSEKPADEAHPYGHTKIESLASLFVGIGIVLFGLYLTYESFQVIFKGYVPETHWLAFVVALLTVAVKEGLYVYTMKVAKKYSSPGLRAIANDHHKDALTSLITIVGTTSAFLKTPYLDSVTSLLMAFVICYIGFKTVKEEAMNLIDSAPDKITIEEALKAAQSAKGVLKVTSLKARKTGRFILMDVKIQVDRKLYVEEGHEIAYKCKEAIMKANDRIKDVMVHVDPYSS